MLVVALVALLSSVVTLSLRDGDADQLEKEALRLSALLESARAQSRASGSLVIWRTHEGGFSLVGLPTARTEASNSEAAVAQQRWSWLSDDTRGAVLQPAGAQQLILGPEPLIPAQTVQLERGNRQLLLATDGLSPFAVVREASSP